MRQALSLGILAALTAALVAATPAPAGQRTRPVSCGVVCNASINCGRHLQPTCSSGGACDSGYVQFTLPDPYQYHCPGFPCSGNTLTFTAGCYDPTNPPTCNECSANGQYQCVSSTGCGGLCDPGLTPDQYGYCVPCGSTGEPVCEDGDPTCDSGLIVAGGVCYSNCGGAGQIVCPNGECQDWHFDTGISVCAACGGDPDSIPGTQSICPTGPACKPNVEQQGLVCINCGQDQEPECGLGDACRDGAEPIGPDQDGNDICAFCGGDGEIACEGGACDGGMWHVTTAGLTGTIDECLESSSAYEKHFVKQNGWCWDDAPESMARSAPESWPADEPIDTAARGTVFLMHGRGSSCGGNMDNVLDTGGLYDTGHLVYCVEYAQEGPGENRLEVKVLPVVDEQLGNPLPTCTTDGTCEFDRDDPEVVTVAAAYDIPGVVTALRDAILQTPTVGDITLIGHSQGGYVLRELLYRHYDDLRWSGRKVVRAVTLAHPYYAKQVDPHRYTPWLCRNNDNFDCATGKWLWGWDLNATGSIDDGDFPQIDWTATSGDPITLPPGPTTSPEDADGDGDYDAADEQCLLVFGGIPYPSVVGDSSVPVESSLGYDEWGFFAAQTVDLDRRYHTACTHNAACLFGEPQLDPVSCVPGSGVGSPVDSCQGVDPEPALVPTVYDPLRPADVLSFDGVDDWLALTDPAALAAFDPADELTVEAWVRPEGQGGSLGGAIVNRPGEYTLSRWNDGRLTFAVAASAPTNWTSIQSDHVLPLGEWTHVAFVFDTSGPNEARFYVNGRLEQTFPAAGSIGDVDGDDTVTVGGMPGRPWDGQLADVRVWTRALSHAEVVAGMGDAPGGGNVAGLVGWWRMDGEGDAVLDQSGNGHDLALSQPGGASQPVRRRIGLADRKGGALYFDGVDDTAAMEADALLPGLEVDETLTLEAWIFPRGNGGSVGMIASKEGEYWIARRSDGFISWAAANAGGWVQIPSTYLAPLHQWSHVALVHDAFAGTATLYVNGAFWQQWAISGAIGDAVANDGFEIGNRAVGSTPFHGVIDEVRVWNVARTATEIADSYDRPLADPTSATGLLGYWTFDEAAGGVALDRSGWGRNLTLGHDDPALSPRRALAQQLPGYRLAYPEACGDGFVDPLEGCDDAGTTGADGCSATCRAETVFEVQGTPMGGTVALDVDGVTVEVVTAAGQSAEDVAAALAAAIEADATLAGAGVTAVAVGTQVFIGGAFDNVVVTDPGLMDCATGLAFPTIDGFGSNVCPETAVRLTTDPGYAEYGWYRDGVPIAGADGPVFDVTLSGDYRVRIGDGSGCMRDSLVAPTYVGFCPGVTEISPPGAIFPLRLAKDPASPTGYYAYFQTVDGVTGFDLLEGELGLWASHDDPAGNVTGIEPCGTPNGIGCYDALGTGEVRIAVAPTAGNRYYLVEGY